MEDAVSRRNSITRRLSLIVGGALVAAVLVVGGMALLEQRRQLTRALETKAASLAQFMAQVSPLGVLSLNFVEMNNNVKKVVLTDDEAVYAIIVNEKGIPLASYLTEADPAVSGEAHALWEGKEPLAAIKAMKQSGRILEVEAPIKVGARQIGTAAVGFSFDRMRHALMLQIALIGVILIAVTGASLFLLTLALRRILRPVRALTSAATQISTGDLNVIVAGTERNDELGVLSRAFESMATQLRGLIAGKEQRMSELRRMGEELRLSSERLQLATRVANIGVWDWDVVNNELAWDDSMYQLYGIRREDFGGAYDAWISAVHPEDKAHTDGEIQAALRGEREYAPEFRIVRPDGFIRHIKANSQTFKDREGKPLRMIGTNIDITDRKRVEDALLFVAQRGWRSGTESFFDALAQFLGERLDMDYVIIDRLDRDPDMAETVALYAKGSIAPNMRYALKGTPCEHVMGKQLCVYPHGIQQLFPDDALLPEMGAESYIGIPLWDSTGRPIGLIAVMGNTPLADDAPVTQLLQLVATRAAAELERKRADEEILKLNQELEQRVADRTSQLEASNKELESFSYSISHDLRAPLRHIAGFVGLLEERIASGLDAKSRHYLDTIADAAHRMSELIDDLLSFSRMGRSEVANARVDLDVLVREVIREFEPETKGRVIDWRIGELPVVRGDRPMLRVVLVNLVSNALKFTRKRARAEIEIGVLPSGDTETVVFVRDNGSGFDMRHADKLFGVFQRLHGIEEFEGTGIGLASVRRIICRHGGRTWAQGEIDGGATIYFALPRSSGSRMEAS